MFKFHPTIYLRNSIDFSFIRNPIFNFIYYLLFLSLCYNSTSYMGASSKVNIPSLTCQKREEEKRGRKEMRFKLWFKIEYEREFIEAWPNILLLAPLASFLTFQMFPIITFSFITLSFVFYTFYENNQATNNSCPHLSLSPLTRYIS